MTQKNDSSRRSFLKLTPVVVLGICAGLGGASRASALQTGNYRRRIVADNCVACGACVNVCPTNAIQQSGGVYIINPNLCIGCGACEPVCPTATIEQGTLIVVPEIESDVCVACAACASECPTGAISLTNSAAINPTLCSGCRLCVPTCPVAAIS